MQVELVREGGSLDGCVLWEPLVTKALATGNIKVLVDPGRLYVDKFKKRFFHGAIGCIKEFFDANRPAVKNYIEAIEQGITYTLDNKDEASRIHAKDWKGYTWQDVAEIRASWGDGWVRSEIDPDQIQEMQFMYDKMVELTEYFKVRPIASEFMVKP
jgi:ABC-type nitrate/sulfonate/bicarbonate transport system substrate-binding protein